MTNEDLMDQGALLSLKQAAAEVGVGTETVRQWVKREQVVAVELNGKPFVGRASLLECERARRRSTGGRPRAVSGR